MNRDIVLGSSIVVGALVLAGSVLQHDANHLKSLRMQNEIACTVEAIVSRQAAQQASAEQTIKQQFLQEQQFISRQFAQQKVRLEEALAAATFENNAQAEQFSAVSGDDALAAFDAQTTVSDASDQSEQIDD